MLFLPLVFATAYYCNSLDGQVCVDEIHLANGQSASHMTMVC